MCEPKKRSTIVIRHAAFARIYGFVLVIAFLFAQTLSVAHAHEHVDENPINQTCEVCILAVNDEGDIDISVDETSDGQDTASFWIRLDRLALPEPKPAPSVDYAERLIAPPPDPKLRPDCARAPPNYI